VNTGSFQRSELRLREEQAFRARRCQDSIAERSNGPSTALASTTGRSDERLQRHRLDAGRTVDEVDQCVDVRAAVDAEVEPADVAERPGPSSSRAAGERADRPRR
jgi:hypothetical protein